MITETIINTINESINKNLNMAYLNDIDNSKKTINDIISLIIKITDKLNGGYITIGYMTDEMFICYKQKKIKIDYYYNQNSKNGIYLIYIN